MTPRGAAARLAALALAVIVGFGPIERIRAALVRDVRLIGAVGDLATGAPIPGALVTIGPRQMWTDASGEFRADLHPGPHDIRVEAPGFVGTTWLGVDPGSQPRLDIGLPPAEPRAEDMLDLGFEVRRAGPDIGLPPDLGTGQGDGGSVPEVWIEQAQNVTSVPAEIRVLMPDGTIVPMETDEYLKGVVPAEMGYVVRRAFEALKAQAIASRTYASRGCLRDSAGDPQVCEPGLDANVDTTTRTQVWRPVHYDVSDDAVDETHGFALLLDGTLIPSLYFARTHEWTVASADGRCCGGRAWPFLQAEASPEAFPVLWGHGSGMSQEGAAAYADWGASAEQILEHYYEGASVTYAQQAAEGGSTEGGSAEGGSAEGGTAGGTAPGQAGVRAAATVKAAEVWIPADAFEIPPGMPASKRAKGIVLDGPRPAVVEGPAVEAEFPFTAVGAAVRASLPPDTGMHLGIRTSRDGVNWGAWVELEFDTLDAKDPSPVGTRWSNLAIVRGKWVQARATLEPSASGSPTFEDVTLHTLNSDAGPAAPIHAKGGTEIVSRSRWGADEALRLDSEGNEIWPVEYTVPRALIVHHTVTANEPADPAAVVRAVYHYHAVSRGWGDVGYNFLVDDRGNVYEGRYGGERDGRITQGGHALQFNTNTIGVALLGTYTAAADHPPPPMLEALEELLTVKAARYGIAPSSPVVLADVRFPYGVLGHRDVLPGHTACPGDGVADLLPDIRARVEAGIDLPTATVPPAPPTSSPTPPPSTVAPPVETAPPTRASPGAGCANLLDGGDFETDAPGWTRSRAYRTGYEAFRGAYSLFVGLTYQDPDEAQSWASASVPIQLPGQITSAVLRYVAKTYGGEDDPRVVRLLDAAGGTVNGSAADLPPGLGWTAFEKDVTSGLQAAGGTEIRASFEVVNSGDGDRSYLRIDDAELVVCTSGDATRPAPTSTSPVATATHAPTAAPELVCADLVDNGSFEAGLTGWHPSGNREAEALQGEAPAGTSALRLGGGTDAFGYAAVEQLMRVPGRALTATLTMAMRRETADTTLVAELRRPGAGRRSPLARSEVNADPSAWRVVRVGLPPEELDQGTIYLAALAPPGSSGSAWIDDVRVEACWIRSWRALAPAAVNRP